MDGFQEGQSGTATPARGRPTLLPSVLCLQQAVTSKLGRRTCSPGATASHRSLPRHHRFTDDTSRLELRISLNGVTEWRPGGVTLPKVLKLESHRAGPLTQSCRTPSPPSPSTRPHTTAPGLLSVHSSGPQKQGQGLAWAQGAPSSVDPGTPE